MEGKTIRERRKEVIEERIQFFTKEVGKFMDLHKDEIEKELLNLGETTTLYKTPKDTEYIIWSRGYADVGDIARLRVNLHDKTKYWVEQGVVVDIYPDDVGVRIDYRVDV